MARYKAQPGSRSTAALSAMAERGPMTSRELAPVMGVAPREVHGQLAHSVRSGKVIKSGSLPIYFALASGGFTFASHDIGRAVSVRRPAVARDVWQYAQGHA